MSYSNYKKSSKLFNKVYNELEGERYFSPLEKQDNRKHFIYSIIYKDYKTLQSYIENIKDCTPCNNELLTELTNVINRM